MSLGEEYQPSVLHQSVGKQECNEQLEGVCHADGCQGLLFLAALYVNDGVLYVSAAFLSFLNPFLLLVFYAHVVNQHIHTVIGGSLCARDLLHMHNPLLLASSLIDGFHRFRYLLLADSVGNVRLPGGTGNAGRVVDDSRFLVNPMTIQHLVGFGHVAGRGGIAHADTPCLDCFRDKEVFAIPVVYLVCNAGSMAVAPMQRELRDDFRQGNTHQLLLGLQ